MRAFPSPERSPNVHPHGPDSTASAGELTLCTSYLSNAHTALAHHARVSRFDSSVAAPFGGTATDVRSRASSAVTVAAPSPRRLFDSTSVCAGRIYGRRSFVVSCRRPRCAKPHACTAAHARRCRSVWCSSEAMRALSTWGPWSARRVQRGYAARFSSTNWRPSNSTGALLR